MIPLGAEGLHLIRPVMAVILVLLAVLYLSYRQTIEAYPSNGGSYTVAKENLGVNAGLLAASALMIDYVLNVAVGISAGIGALTSAAPQLHPYTLELCLGVLALITLANLRGTLEACLTIANFATSARASLAGCNLRSQSYLCSVGIGLPRRRCAMPWCCREMSSQCI